MSDKRRFTEWYKAWVLYVLHIGFLSESVIYCLCDSGQDILCASISLLIRIISYTPVILSADSGASRPEHKFVLPNLLAVGVLGNSTIFLCVSVSGSVKWEIIEPIVEGGCED